MNLKAIMDLVATDSRPITLIFLIVITLVQVAPIKVNPWSAIFGWLGRQLNKDVSARIDNVDKRLDTMENRMDSLETRIDSLENRFNIFEERLDSVDSRLTTHIQSSEAAELKVRRKAILDFASSVIRGINFHKEKFDFMLSECDAYVEYCHTHEITNGVADASMSEIRRIYQEHLRNNDFLTEKIEMDISGTFKNG